MTEPEKAKIERINEVSAAGRTLWLALLGYLAFVGITLLGVQDADFFVPTRQTQLPLANVAIPTASFFFFAPVLGAALYGYLHIHLLKLWDSIADTPAAIDGQPLGEHLNPWLVNDWALTRKGGGAIPPRPLRWFGNRATELLVWASGPIVLLFFWWWSMPAHEPLLSLTLGLCLIFTLHAGTISWLTAGGWLSTPRRDISRIPVWRRRDPWLLVALVGSVTLLRTIYPLQLPGFFIIQTIAPDWYIGAFSTLAPVNLAGVEMVDLPETWRTPETARAAFRRTWCEREGLSMAVCDHPPSTERPTPLTLGSARKQWCDEHATVNSEDCLGQFDDLDTRFEAAWREERDASLANLPGLDLTGRDLRNADAAGTSLVRADLIAARLQRAILVDARLEGANLAEASLDGAFLIGARLDGAYLWGAGLQRADLEKARLDGADLRYAQLQGAGLVGARLEGADLTGTELEGATLEGARLQRAYLGARMKGAFLANALMEEADLRYADFREAYLGGASIRSSPAHFADFRGAEELTQAQLSGLIGNMETLLPEGQSDANEPWYVWSCWDQPPAGFEGLLARAVLYGENAEELRAEFLCGPDNPRHKTGRRLALDEPYPESHPLAERDG